MTKVEPRRSGIGRRHGNVLYLSALQYKSAEIHKRAIAHHFETVSMRSQPEDAM